MSTQLATSFARFTVEKTAGTKTRTVRVKGFASLTGADRDLDDIDVTKFDVETFMGNPQLWYNHKPWMRPDGNPVSIGKVDSAVVSRAALSDNVFSIVPLGEEKAVDTVKQTDYPALRDGDLGLWVECTVLEDDVAGLVRDGRLNGFSWQGEVTRKGSTGEIVSIDLREISLVNLPANARCLFTITKSEARTASYVLAWTNGITELGDADVSGAVPAECTGAEYQLLIEKSGQLQPPLELANNADDDAQQTAVSFFQRFKDVSRVALLKHANLAVPDLGYVYEIVFNMERGAVTSKAAWSTAYINAFPDSSFAYIEPGGEKDEDGKTTPRSLRHFPIKDPAGNPDRAHVLNALARISQSPFGEKARPKIEAAARKLGIQLGKKALSSDDAALLSDNEPDTEGGECTVDEEQLKKAIEPIAASLTSISERLSVLEKKEVAAEVETPQEEIKTPSADPAPNEEAAEAAAPAAAPPETDAVMKSLLEGVAKELKSIGQRLSAIETAPAPSAANTAEEARAEEIRKSFAGLPLADQQKMREDLILKRTAKTLIPDSVLSRH